MRYLSQMKFYKHFLEENKDYLKRGIYVPSSNLRTYTLPQYRQDNWFPSGKYTLKNIVKILIARAFYSVIVRKDGSKFSAQAIYFSNMPQQYNRDAKFFDFDKKRIRTVCPNQKRYDLYMRNRLYFEKYFPMVDLLFADDEHYIYEEKIIEKMRVPDSEWNTVFRYLLGIYSAYYETPGIDQMHVAYQYKHLSNHIDKKGGEQVITLYRQHGDLSSDNFIYDVNGKVYFIDYDHANYYPAYYDLFFLMIHLYIWEGNDIGIKFLINGAFDDCGKNIKGGSIASKYDAFLLFADYHLEVCAQEGLHEQWQRKYEKIFCGILDQLRKK